MAANQHDGSPPPGSPSPRAPTSRGGHWPSWRHGTRGDILPLVTIVTNNGGPFRSFRFEAFIATHPELRHVRTSAKTPEQNGSRERGFGSLKYERLFFDEFADALDLARHAEGYRVEYNTVRPTRHWLGTDQPTSTPASPTPRTRVPLPREPAAT